MESNQVNHSPPVINHTNVPLGTGYLLMWGFGDEESPEDLTGREVKLVLRPGTRNQEILDLSYTDGWFTWDVDTAQCKPITSYVITIDGQARVRGSISTGLEVTYD